MIARIVVVVCVLLLGILAWNASTKKTDLGAEYRYAVPQIEKVQQIHIMDRSGRGTLLTRSDDHWTYNGTHRAREDAMENLLNTIKRVELAYIPRPQALKNIIKGLSSEGVRVSIYGPRERLLKCYYVGGSTPDERGTYMIMEGSDQPAIVTMPNFEGSLRTRFVMSSLEWRDRIILRYEQEEIRGLTVEYPAQATESFALVKNENGWMVQPLNENANSNRKPRAGSVEAYVRAYKKVGAEALIDDETLTKDLSKLNAFAILTLDSEDGHQRVLSFYPIHHNDHTSVRDRIERYHCLDEDGNLYLVQHLVFKDLFIGIGFFFTEDLR